MSLKTFGVGSNILCSRLLLHLICMQLMPDMSLPLTASVGAGVAGPPSLEPQHPAEMCHQPPGWHLDLWGSLPDLGVWHTHQPSLQTARETQPETLQSVFPHPPSNSRRKKKISAKCKCWQYHSHTKSDDHTLPSLHPSSEKYFCLCSCTWSRYVFMWAEEREKTKWLTFATVHIA